RYELKKNNTVILDLDGSSPWHFIYSVIIIKQN
ncbi:MAG: hypothetical protein ACI9K1_002821, partial [Arcticibacterium sp.]